MASDPVFILNSPLKEPALRFLETLTPHYSQLPGELTDSERCALHLLLDAGALQGILRCTATDADSDQPRTVYFEVAGHYKDDLPVSPIRKDRPIEQRLVRARLTALGEGWAESVRQRGHGFTLGCIVEKALNRRKPGKARVVPCPTDLSEEPRKVEPGVAEGRKPEALHCTPLPNPPAPKQTPRGKRGEEKWREASDKMLDLLQERRLPNILRDAAKLINMPFSTTRTAAHKSTILRAHFNLSDAPTTKSTVLDDMAATASPEIRRLLKTLSTDRRQKVELAIEEMDPGQALEVLRTLAVNPESGRVGDYPLIDEADIPADCNRPDPDETQ